MRKPLGRAVLGACTVWLGMAISNPAPIRGQALEGRVIDAGSGAPIAVASVGVLRDERPLLSVISDSLGRFRVALPGAGRYSLRVARLGYDTLTTEAVSVSANQLVELEVRLGVDPIPLGALVITSRRAVVGPHSDYYRRLESGRRTGRGDFITRADLAAAGLPFLSSYVARIPGVTLSTSGGRTYPLLDHHCFPAIYMNGVPLDLAKYQRPPPSIDDLFDAESVEGIEVYSRRSEIPPEYARPDVCGVIVAWMRLPQPGSSRPRKWLIAGGLVALSALIYVAF